MSHHSLAVCQFILHSLFIHSTISICSVMLLSRWKRACLCLNGSNRLFPHEPHLRNCYWYCVYSGFLTQPPLFPPLLFRLTGFQVPAPVTSTGNVFSLRLTSDFAVSAHGFKLNYEGKARGGRIDVWRDGRTDGLKLNHDAETLEGWIDGGDGWMDR